MTEKPEEELKKNLEALIALPLLLVLAFPMLVWRGFALTKLWVWFAVPAGAIELTLAQVCGLLIIFASLQRLREDQGNPLESLKKTVIRGALLPVLYLGLGWLVKAAL